MDGKIYFVKIPYSVEASESGVNGEIAAKRTADLLRPNFEMPSVARRTFPDGAGVVSSGLTGAPLIEAGLSEASRIVQAISPTRRRDAVIFDYVIGNADRNAGNVFVDGGTVRLIDNESAYATSLPPVHSFLRRHALALASDNFEVAGEFVERILESRDQILSIAEQEGISAAARDALSARLARLQLVAGTSRDFDGLFLME